MSIKVAIIEDSKAYVSEVSHYLKTHDIEMVNIGYNGKEALEKTLGSFLFNVYE